MSFVLCAFTNQSNKIVTATVTLNTELIGNIAGAEKPAKARSQNYAQAIPWMGAYYGQRDNAT